MVAYPGSAIGFIQIHIHSPSQLKGDTKLNENTQELPPNWIIDFTEVHK